MLVPIIGRLASKKRRKTNMYYIFISKFTHTWSEPNSTLNFLGPHSFPKDVLFSREWWSRPPPPPPRTPLRTNLQSVLENLWNGLEAGGWRTAVGRVADEAAGWSTMHGCQCCGGSETQFGKCWPTLGNATREPQKLPLAKCCCNFTTMLFFAISQVFGTTGNADVRVTMKVHIYYMGLII